MPNKEISNRELEAVLHWVQNKGGSKVQDSFRNPDFIKRGGVWNVAAEPLAMYPITGFVTMKQRRFQLMCSNNHAQELEEAGIVRFSEVSQQGVQTP